MTTPWDRHGWLPLHHAQPKLTPAQRDEIAYLRGAGKSCAEIAREYGVSTTVVSNIAIREP